MKINESGRSMIEMLGVLSIIGILSTSGISLYSKAMYKRRVSQVIDQISEISNNIHNVYMSRRNYKDLAIPESKEKDKHKIVPEAMWAKNGTKEIVASALHGAEITFGARDDNNRFYISTTTGDDKEACISLVTADWGEGNYVCSIEVGKSTKVVDDAGKTVDKCAEGSMTAADAATNCACSGTTSCKIGWVMR